eukprot:4795822-Alexandrium_andersonii.AAC.1
MADSSDALCTNGALHARCAAAIVHASPGASPRRREAAWNATTAQGAPSMATAVHNPRRKARDASTVTRTCGCS